MFLVKIFSMVPAAFSRDPGPGPGRIPAGTRGDIRRQEPRPPHPHPHAKNKKDKKIFLTRRKSYATLCPERDEE